MPHSFDYLDLGSFRSLYCNPELPLQMKFYVEGIKCSKCIAKIENLKLENQELQNLVVNLGNQTALVELRDFEQSFARVAEDIAMLGFRPVPIKPSEEGAVVVQLYNLIAAKAGRATELDQH